ncbi:MAG: phosphopantetheine-binding protein [Crocinitomicaceae bacterium]
MRKFELLTDFIQFLESELLLDKGEVQATSQLRQLRTWSSLNALILISRINDETAIVLTASDLAKCITVADLHQHLSNQ